MSSSPPLVLRIALIILALAAMACIGYLILNADKYLFSTGRWLILGSGTFIAAVVIGLGFRWREFAVYVVLTTVSVLVALFGAEAALNIMEAPKLINLGNFGGAQVAKLVREAQSKGQRLSPQMGHEKFKIPGGEAVKLGGPSNTPILIYDPVALEWQKIVSDRYGHFNDDDIWRRGPIDVLVVGSSHTQGSGARIGRDFVSLLKSQNETVARLSIGGVAGLIKLGMVREFGPILKPRTVFWVYADRNDLEEDLGRELKVPLLAEYLNPDYRQNLPALETELDQALAAKTEQILSRYERLQTAGKLPPTERQFDLGEFAKLRLLRQRLGIAVGTPVSPAQFSTWTKLLATAKQDVENWGGRIVFAYLPMVTTLRTGNDDPFKPQVLKVLRELDIPVIDLTKELLALDVPIDIFRMKIGRLSNHYNEDGHRLVAQKMLDYLNTAR